MNVQSGEIFISLAKAFSVSLDYLARLASHSAPQVSIADLDLLEKVQIVDQPSEDDRELVKREMDLVVMKSQVRLLAGEGAVVE